MDRLLLVRHATTADTRAARFPATTGAVAVPGCADLDVAGERQARALADHLPGATRCWSSLAARAVATARAAGLRPQLMAQLAECDFGSWRGRDVRDVQASEPEALAAWYADPDARPHGGEGLAQVRTRARWVLERAATADGTTVAVTHGGMVKAVLLEILELPATAVWRLEAAPASVTELHPGPHGSWRLVRLNWTPTLARSPRRAA